MKRRCVTALGISYRVLLPGLWEKSYCTETWEYLLCRSPAGSLVHLTILISFSTCVTFFFTGCSLLQLLGLGFLSGSLSSFLQHWLTPSFPAPLGHLFVLSPNTLKPFPSIVYFLARVLTCSVNGSFLISLYWLDWCVCNTKALLSLLWALDHQVSNAKAGQYSYVYRAFVAERREGHSERKGVVKICWNETSSARLAWECEVGFIFCGWHIRNVWCLEHYILILLIM